MSFWMNDKDFLKQLTLQQTKTVYARIISLTIDGAPVEAIEGRVTGGSLNIDGNAAIRRSCSLTLVGQDLKITDYYWALKSRFSLEIGVENTTNSEYPKICWFKQGIFVVNSFSKSHSINNVNISISGQDKMCLLNGSLGGAIGAETNFGEYDYIDEEGGVTSHKLPIKTILEKAIQEYAKEPLSNIIINDLDNLNGWNLWNYRGDSPLYYFYKINNSGSSILTLTNITTEGNTSVYVAQGDERKQYFLNYLNMLQDKSSTNKPFKQDSNLHGEASAGWEFYLSPNSNTKYHISRVLYGQDAGYQPTELTYPGDLILKQGEAITSLFDKIKSMLGAYEYFYDVEGRFVFQKQKTYTQGLFTPVVGANAYVVPAVTLEEYSYTFDDATLVSAFSNSTNVNDVKNDFSVWGTKKGVGSNSLPIHGRYAVMRKPKRYKAFDGTIYLASKVDWRELIYQMALDQYEHRDDVNYRSKLIENNPEFYKGITGYEPFYIDMLGFWRTIYDGKKFLPESLDASQLFFWIDFLEPYGELEQFANEVIGNRCKVDSGKSNVKSMWLPNVPEVQFLLPKNEGDKIETEGSGDGTSAYQKIQISKDLALSFVISSRGTTVSDAIDQLVNKHLLTTQSITLTTLPIYYLQPNTRIYVKDEESGIEGDYIMTKLSLPLTYNGTTSITATKVIDAIV